MTQDQFIDNFFKYAGKIKPAPKNDPLDDIFNAIFTEPKQFETVYLTEQQLRCLKTRTAKAGETLKAAFLGTIWLPYGDENYYLLDNGEVVTEYYSIGD